MNISPCLDCSEMVSENASTCPHCGAPGPARQRRRAFWKKVLFRLGIVAIIWAAVAIYEFRVDSLTRSLGGIPMGG